MTPSSLPVETPAAGGTAVETHSGPMAAVEHHTEPVYTYPSTPISAAVSTPAAVEETPPEYGTEHSYPGGSAVAAIAAPPPPTPPRAPRAPRVARPVAATPAPVPAVALPVVTPSVITPPPAPGGLLGLLMFLRGDGKPKKKRRGLQYLIEHKLETPVFFIVSLTMMIRASQIFSGGQLIMSKLLGDKYPTFEIITGIGLAIGSEMLMTIAGRSWKSWKNEATDTQARPGMSKIARTAYVTKARQSARYSQAVMFVGMATSLFAGLAFLFTNSGKPLDAATLQDPAWWGNFIIDLVACTVVTTTVFFLGVLKETMASTDAEEAIANIKEGISSAVDAAIVRFKNGVQTPVDEKLIAEHLPPGEKAKFTRAVAKISQTKSWTSRELRTRLGIDNDATLIRKLNRKINDLAKNPDLGLDKVEKMWIIPTNVIFAEWLDEIVAHDAKLLQAKTVAEPAVAA